MQLNTVEEALEELRAGRIILCIDDPDRENEGDMICAARFATTENVNFMAKNARGLIGTPMSEAVAARWGVGADGEGEYRQPLHGLHRIN